MKQETTGVKVTFSQQEIQIQFSGHQSLLRTCMTMTALNSTDQTDKHSLKNAQQLNTKGLKKSLWILASSFRGQGPTRAVIALRQQHMHLNVTAKWECSPTRHAVQRNSCNDKSNISNVGTLRHSMVDIIRKNISHFAFIIVKLFNNHSHHSSSFHQNVTRNCTISGRGSGLLTTVWCKKHPHTRERQNTFTSVYA